MKKIYFHIFLLFFISNSAAQKLTGTWEGILDEYEFLQINIVEVGDNLCGYTWDYDLNNKQSYCKAYFKGSYNKLFDSWYLEGYSFMENSGGHALMQLKFNIVMEDGKIVMKGLCRTKPVLFFGSGNVSEFLLKKISSRPTQLTQAMKDCMAENLPIKKEKILEKNLPKKDTTILPSITVPNTTQNALLPAIKKDTIAIKPENRLLTSLPKETNKRANKVLRHIVINDRKITLNIYDNGTIDGDTVSIYYNGKAILKNKRLTANPIIVDIELDENSALHSIVLFAENLGSIPPNTALVVFTTKEGKRYELYASTTLQQNAEIIFEYKPK